MTFEDVDLQWTIISNQAARAVLASIRSSAETAGWAVTAMELKDAEDNALPWTTSWPDETFGSARYTKSEGSTEYALFWSTYSSGGVSKITGGLYIRQFAATDTSFGEAADSAFVDLLTLFPGDDICSLTLVLEDDDGIDIGPGIVGRYRPALWETVSSSHLPGLEPRATDDGWIEVRPADLDSETPQSVWSMPDQTRTSIERVQVGLTEFLWADEPTG